MSSPARILFFNHTRQSSGAERVLLNMLAVLDPGRYQATVACPTLGKGDLDQLIRDQGSKVLAAPVLDARFTSNPFTLLRHLASASGAIASLRRLIR